MSGLCIGDGGVVLHRVVRTAAVRKLRQFRMMVDQQSPRALAFLWVRDDVCSSVCAVCLTGD